MVTNREIRDLKILEKYLFITRSEDTNTEFDETKDILEIFSESRESSPLILDTMFILIIDGRNVEFNSSDHRLET